MKVLYDHNAFKSVFGGVSRCTVELIKNFPATVSAEIAVRVSDCVYLKDSALIPELKSVKVTSNNFISRVKYPGKITLYRIATAVLKSIPTYEHINKPFGVRALQKGDFDIFHCPSTNPDTDLYFLDYLQDKPFVLTVHDMVSELFGSEGNRQTFVKKRLVERADKIVVVSENTKRDLLNLMDVPEDKVTVIYHGAPEVLSYVPKRLFPEDYFLYVGRRDGYKNFSQTLVDFSIFHKFHPEIKLICTGSEFNRHESYLINKLKLSGYVLTIAADEQQMNSLYANAIAFLFPSLYEGFGLPVLESMACGCPAILNETSCFPEIASDAALYFHSNPNEKSSNLPEIMERVYSMSMEERNTLIFKGYERCGYFSWKKASSLLADVFSELI